MPAPPRWLLAVPDAIRQLEKLDRDLLTRRDVEKLFRRLAGAGGAADADVRGGARRGGARPPAERAPAPAPEVPGSGPRSAARSSGARAWWPSSGRRG